MRMPEILNGHTLTVKEKIYPQQMGIQLKADDLSTATIVMDADGPEVKPGDWIRVWAPNGLCCVMYVKGKDTDYTEKRITLTLEHVFGMLDEMVIFEEMTPESMGGGTTVAAASAIQQILTKQTESLFSFGGCDFTDAQGWSFTNTTIRSALTDIAEAIQDCQWEFDFTSVPFAIYLKQFPTEDSMEMRRNRNLDTLQISLDRSEMFTRVYPIGNKDLHISGNYLEKNTSIWGTVSKVITDSSITDATLLQAWAQAQLNRNAEPVITISISGAELSEDTGETLDKLIPGRICRVPLPEYGTTVQERLVSLAWRNCIADETTVTVNMANQHKTIQGILNEQARGGSAGGRKASVKTGCDLHDHEDRITDEEEISYQAGMYLDDYGYIQYSAEKTTNIGSRFLSLYNQMGMAVGGYNIDITKLKEYPSRSSFPATGAEGWFYGDASTNKVYTWNGTQYVLFQEGDYFIQAGNICMAINESGESEARIEADHVIITGETTIDDVFYVDNNGLLCQTHLIVDTNCLLYARGGIQAGTFELDTSGNLTGVESIEYDNDVYQNVADVTVNTTTNSLEITYVDGTTATFSKATTLDITESGGTYTVTAKQGSVVVAGPEYITPGSISGSPYIDANSVDPSNTASGTVLSRISRAIKRTDVDFVNFKVACSCGGEKRYYIEL